MTKILARFTRKQEEVVGQNIIEWKQNDWLSQMFFSFFVFTYFSHLHATPLENKIYLLLTCYICQASEFSRKQALLAHSDGHGIQLRPAKPGKPVKNNVIFVPREEAKWHEQ